MLASPWQLPSGRRTQTLATPLSSVVGMWNVRLIPVLPQTGDLGKDTHSMTSPRYAENLKTDKTCCFIFTNFFFCTLILNPCIVSLFNILLLFCVKGDSYCTYSGFVSIL